MFKETPPFHVLSAGLAIALLLFFLALHVASGQPWLGFTAVPSPEGVRISRVDADGPVAGQVHKGEVLLALRSSTGTLSLESWDAVAEPDDAREFAVYNRFFERHAQLWDILHGQDVQLRVQPLAVDSGPPVPARWVSLQPEGARGLIQLPLLFWYQVVCGLAVLLMGVAAWAFVQTERGPLLYALAGLAIAVAIIASAVYTTRELTLAPDWFLLLSQANQAGAMLFAGTGTALFWYYPLRLGRFPFERFMLPVVLATLAANWLQWWPNLDIAARYPLLAWFAVDILFACIQWRWTRYEPVARARLKWLLAAWFAGAFGYLLLVVFPQVIGYPSVAHQTHAWAFFVLTYLGIALGIVRYRLFDLDRWILLAWFWFAFGVLFIVLDAFLILLLDLETSMGLLVSLAVVGWVYLPIRQGFLLWLAPDNPRGALHQRLPRILQQAFEYQRPIPAQWRKALQEIYDPLRIEEADEVVGQPEIRDNGLRLAVPAVDEGPAQVLSYAAGGRRLFDRKDLDFCQQALTLFSYAQQYHHSYQTGVISERQRVARDLHDDVGARLLSVVYRAQGSDELQQLARDCLRELREVIQGLQKGAVQLQQSYARWQAEARERCRLFGLALDMQLDPAARSWLLSPRIERNLSRILREACSNTFKHGAAATVHVRLWLAGECLILEYRDDGGGLRAARLDGDGVGLRGMRQRSEELGGEIVWWSPLEGGLAMRCEIPLGGGQQT